MSGWESVSVSVLTLFRSYYWTELVIPRNFDLNFDEEKEKMIGKATSGLPDCSSFRWTTNLGTSSWSWSPARQWQGWRSSWVFWCPVWLWASLWTLDSCLCLIRDILISTVLVYWGALPGLHTHFHFFFRASVKYDCVKMYRGVMGRNRCYLIWNKSFWNHPTYFGRVTYCTIDALHLWLFCFSLSPLSGQLNIQDLFIPRLVL